MQCKQFSEFRHDYWSGCLFLSLASYWLFNHFKLAQMVCFVRPFLNLLFVKDCRRIFISHNGIHQQRLLLELYLTSPIKWQDKHRMRHCRRPRPLPIKTFSQLREKILVSFHLLPFYAKLLFLKFALNPAKSICMCGLCTQCLSIPLPTLTSFFVKNDEPMNSIESLAKTPSCARARIEYSW